MTESESDGIVSAFMNIVNGSEHFDKWMFRDSKPEFEEGEVLKIYMPNTISENETVNARIGDTTIEIKDPSPDIEGSLIEIRILQFNVGKSHGEAELISAQ